MKQVVYSNRLEQAKVGWQNFKKYMTSEREPVTTQKADS